MTYELHTLHMTGLRATSYGYLLSPRYITCLASPGVRHLSERVSGSCCFLRQGAIIDRIARTLRMQPLDWVVDLKLTRGGSDSAVVQQRSFNIVRSRVRGPGDNLFERLLVGILTFLFLVAS